MSFCSKFQNCCENFDKACQIADKTIDDLPLPQIIKQECDLIAHITHELSEDVK